MAVAYTHKPMDARIVHFGLMRIREIEEVIKEGQNEIEMWRAVIDQQALCTLCRGEKKVLQHIAQDDSEWITCDRCAGTGKRGV